MTNTIRRPRKLSDQEVIRLNRMGLPLSSIAKKLGVNTSSVGSRLATLGVKPADTRRAFMEDIYNDLSEEQRDKLSDQLEGYPSVKSFMKTLLVSHLNQTQKAQNHEQA